MMGIIVDQYHLIFLEMEVETTARTGKGRHTILISSGVTPFSQARAIAATPFSILTFHGNAQFHIGDTDFRTNKVEGNISVANTNIFSVKVRYFRNGMKGIFFASRAPV